MNSLLGISMPKINYKRFTMIALFMTAMMLTGWLALGFSEQTFYISGFIAAAWGVGLYIHLDRIEKRRKDEHR